MMAMWVNYGLVDQYPLLPCLSCHEVKLPNSWSRRYCVSRGRSLCAVDFLAKPLNLPARTSTIVGKDSLLQALRLHSALAGLCLSRTDCSGAAACNLVLAYWSSHAIWNLH